MLKWLAGIIGGIIAGVVVYWLTVGGVWNVLFGGSVGNPPDDRSDRGSTISRELVVRNVSLDPVSPAVLRTPSDELPYGESLVIRFQYEVATSDQGDTIWFDVKELDASAKVLWDVGLGKATSASGKGMITFRPRSVPEGHEQLRLTGFRIYAFVGEVGGVQAEIPGGKKIENVDYRWIR